MANLKRLTLLLTTVLSLSTGQDYNNEYQDYADGYQQDNLYTDYAMKQQEKR
jgi:hypothetical protein